MKFDRRRMPGARFPILWSGLLFMGVLSGCSTTSPRNGSLPASQTPNIVSGIDRQESMPEIQKFREKYGRPKYIHAWSCTSGHEALKDLMLQLSVSVNVSSVSLSSRKDLVVHSRTMSRLSTDSMEALNGLILRKSGSCTFVAINPKNARDYYTIQARNHEKDVSDLFNQLDQSHSSLDRFRAARKLTGFLKELRTEHDAMALFGVTPKRLTVSELRLRRMKEALSFQVKAMEGVGYTSIAQVLQFQEDPEEEEVTSDYLTKRGYRVVNPMEDPAFLVRITVRKVILPVQAWESETNVLFSVEARIIDRKSGKVLRKKVVENKLAVRNFAPVNAPYADPDATDALVEDLLAGLKDKSSDAVTESDRF